MRAALLILLALTACQKGDGVNGAAMAGLVRSEVKAAVLLCPTQADKVRIEKIRADLLAAIAKNAPQDVLVTHWQRLEQASSVCQLQGA